MTTAKTPLSREEWDQIEEELVNVSTLLSRVGVMLLETRSAAILAEETAS